MIHEFMTSPSKIIIADLGTLLLEAHLGPLSSFLHVPLSWLSSSTHAFFPDETNTTIRRIYTHPSQGHSKRHFCGFCGTPISYWTEEPRSESEFINITLGSLMRDDLLRLDALGLVNDDQDHTTAPPLALIQKRRKKKKQRTGEEGEDEAASSGVAGKKGAGQPQKGLQKSQQQSDNRQSDVKDWSSEPLPNPVSQIQMVSPTSRAAGPPEPVETYGVPWFDSLLVGSRLQKMSNLKRTTGSHQSKDGRVRSQWEIIEWTNDDDKEDDDVDDGGGDDDDDDDSASASDRSKETTSSGSVKRKRGSSAPYQATVEDATE
jgi:hypothetical protein